MTRNSVVCLYDADGVFVEGAEFSQQDLREGTIQAAGETHWANGSRFLIKHNDGRRRKVFIRCGWCIDLDNKEVLVRKSKNANWVWMTLVEWAEWMGRG